MVIYIEQVLIDNFIINFFILLTLSFVLKAKIKKINILFSSLLGSIIALITPIFNFVLFFNILIKILLSLVMITILKRYKKFKEFLIHYLTFLLITFLFGGACLFLLTTFDKSFNASNYASYKLPLGVIVVIAFFLTLCVKSVFKNIYKRKVVNNYVYKIKVFNNNESDELLAFLDSGNCLVDEISKKPIVIIDYNSLKNTLNDINLTDILLCRTANLSKIFKNPHIQQVSSINNASKLLVVEVEKIEIFLEDKVNVITNACVGLTIKSFINDLGYNALLNPQLF